MNDSIEKIIDEALKKLEEFWNDWQPMPSPEKCRKIGGPKSSGVYQVINNQTGELILFGIGEKCQKRMKSLFPSPYGTGTRNNEYKRSYILENWQVLEYRTLETGKIETAKSIEHLLIARNNHLFNT